MIATVKSLNDAFPTYTINNVVSVQYVKNNLILTYITGDDVQVAKYAAENVAVEIH